MLCIMAEQSPKQEGIEKLKHEITCSICLDDFDDPKRLPCWHIYCKVPCLQELLQRSKDSTLNCPECLSVAQFSDNELDSLPNAFLIHRLKEVYSELAKAVDKNAVECASPKDISHTFIQQQTDALIRTEEVKREVLSHKEKLNQEIAESIDALHHVLEEQKQALLMELQKQTDLKLAEIKTKQQNIETADSKLQQIIESDLTTTKPDAMNCQLKEVIDSFSPLSFNPADLVARVLPPLQLKQACILTNYVEKGEPNRHKCSAIGDGLLGAEIDTPTTFTVHVANEHDIPCSGKVSVELKTVRDGAIARPQVTACSPSHYRVSYTPTERGRHELSIKVNGEHITDSPFKMFVHMPVSKIKDPVAEITDLVGPTGLHSAAERILVCDYGGNQIAVYNHSFKRIATVGEELRFFAKKLKGPAEVTTNSQSNIYVTTVEDNSLHKFTKDGIHIKTVTGTGRKGGQFNFPNGMCVFEDQFLYICDSNNCRVLVFDLNLKYLSEVSGCYADPTGLDVDTSGKLYICDRPAHGGCIKVVTPDGQHENTIMHQLNRPVNVKIVGEVLYVSDCERNYILSYTLSGDYVGAFGQEYLTFPEGLAIDDDGFFYVRYRRRCVLVF